MSILVATFGGPIDLLDIDPTRITPQAIAQALARINRWGGNTELPISVAQHSVLVFEIYKKLNPGLAANAIFALLHDGHQYLISDVLTPTVKVLEHAMPGVARHVENLKHQVDMAIRSALMLPNPTMEIYAAIAEADRLAAAIEWLSFVPESNGACPYGAPPRGLPTRIKARAWPDAEEAFLSTLTRELTMRSWERAA